MSLPQEDIVLSASASTSIWFYCYGVALAICVAVAFHWLVFCRDHVNADPLREEQPVLSERESREKWLATLDDVTRQHQQQQERERAAEQERKQQEDESNEEFDASHGTKRFARKKKQQPRATQVMPSLPSCAKDVSDLTGFYSWYNVETSLYRIYAIGRNDQEVICPFVPRSERGQVSVELAVTSDMEDDIEVYWVTYKGVEERRGSIKPRGTWLQTTWMGHPWVFRTKNGQLLLHYIPYKTCPTIPDMQTTSEHDDRVGLYRFTLSDKFDARIQNHSLISQHDRCRIVDPIFPLEFSSSNDALQWTLQQMTRWSLIVKPINVDLILTYLMNVLKNPSEAKYRQIRIANSTFFNEVWNTPSRGVFLVAGFVEHGAHAQLGANDTLEYTWIQHLSNIVMELQQYKTKQENLHLPAEQPEGADGYGRAGFGLAGQMQRR